jgi:hypothetical protein
MEQLATAIANLDDDSYRDRILRADGSTLDAILAGVQLSGQKLVANKTFGKGTRGAKRLALEARLREVIGLAGERSSIAKSIRSTSTLAIAGGGDGAVLDVRSLAQWSSLRVLRIDDGGRVSGLDALTQLTELRVKASEIDVRELGPLARCFLQLNAPVLRHPESLADGPVFDSIGLTTHPPFPALRAQRARLSTLVDVKDLGPIASEIVDLSLFCEYGDRLRLGSLPKLQRLDCGNFASIVAESVPRELQWADFGGIESLEFLSAWPLVELRLSAPIPDLAPLPETLRRLQLRGRDAAKSVLGAPPLALEHLTLDAATHGGPVAYSDLKSAVARFPRLRSLAVRGWNLESLFELPNLADLEELDLTGCGGFLELAHVETRYPKLQRLIVRGTGLTKKDLAGLTRVAVEM